MKPPSGRQVLAGAIVVVVAAAIAVGVATLGPPSEERARRLDERRVEHLQHISSSVSLFQSRHGRIPASLAELSAEPGIRFEPRDPVTGDPYTYRAVDEAVFELCAVFDREATESWVTGFRAHEAGRQCFTEHARETPPFRPPSTRP